MQIGDPVTYVDELGIARAALVTHVGGQAEESDCWINLVFVSPDPKRDDTYGRQVERETSVVHKSKQSAPGSYWQPA